MGQGGTGYQNPGNGTTSSPGPNGMDYFGATARMNALAALPAMDLVMVWGGANDASFGTFPMATTVSRANAMWSAIKAARPNTPLIVGGIESGVYPSSSADLDTLNDALSAAAVSNSAVTAYVDQRNPEKWVSGTGKLTSQTGDGNADIFVSSDGVHPTHAGWGYVAERAVRAMLNVRI